VCRARVFAFLSREAASNEKALRKRDARNAIALRLAHVSAGWGVPPDRQRIALEAGGQGKPLAVSPPNPKKELGEQLKGAVPYDQHTLF
jgi:hypothetical protein